MKNIIITLLLLPVTFLARSQTIPAINSTEDKIAGLSIIWSELKYNFVNIDRLNFSLDSLYQATIPKVLATKNDPEYYEVLQRFMASMNDGHTQIARRSFGWNEYYDYIPAIISEYDGKFYFTEIRRNAGVDTTLLNSEIIEVENLPTIDYIKANYYPDISASTPQSRLMMGTTKLMQGVMGSVLTGKARKQNGQIVDFNIVRNGETTRKDNDSFITSVKKTRDRELIKLVWQGQIAILEVNSFGNKTMMYQIDSLADIIHAKGAKGLVIDLRANGGGNTSTAYHLQMYLTHTDSMKVFGGQMRVNNGYYRAQGNYRPQIRDYYEGKAYEILPSESIKVKEEIKPFDIPVAILIGRYSFSACEDFLVNLYEVPNRPVYIGEPTGGSTGAPLLVKLPNDGYARICTLRIRYTYSNKLFVGEGVQPDICVITKFDDYIKGKDKVLEKAISYLKNKLKNSSVI